MDEKVKDLFYTVPIDGLREVGMLLGMLEIELGGTRRVVLTTVSRKLDTDIQNFETDEEKLGLLERVDHILSSCSENGSSVQDHINQQVHSLGEVSNLGNGVDGISLGERAKDKRVYVRGEIKIKGQIAGRDGLGLSWEALKRQVEGLKREHKSMRICDAVVQAVAQGTALRKLLDCKPELTLESVMKIIRSSFGEIDNTVLFNQLANAVQGVGEGTLDFVMRLMGLKGKILSGRVGDVTFNAMQVQKVFCKSLENGLISEAIRTKLRPLLETSPDDEALLEEIGDIVLGERERDGKLKRGARVKRVEVLEDGDTAEREGLKAQIQHLAAKVEQLKSEKRDFPSWGGRPRSSWGCTKCKAAGVGARCRHCYRCGGENHIAARCSENGQRLANADS